MLAVDTNVIVRYLTRDDPEQSMRARRLVDNAEVFVSSTVLLETEWVLCSAYGFSPARIAERLRAFAGLPQVTVEAPSAMAVALDWMTAGMEFADALHLASAGQCEAFVTFDRRLANTAQRLGNADVRVL
jgi:predicted nucleic acid-binding protein